MVAITEAGSARREPSLVRFDGVQRAVHWATAMLFAILMATALALYFPSIGALVGRRELLAQIHLWAGIALPVPLLAALAGPWGGRLRTDIRRVNSWTVDEIRWLRTLGRDGGGVVDKFNPGQKLNTIFIGCAMAVMLATGIVLKWFDHFPLTWRQGSTLVHDVFALAVFVVVAGHVLLALTHRDALRSMFRGRVSESWARRHAPGWLEEESS
jgi:formate dehydrogenase subunit gamma